MLLPYPDSPTNAIESIGFIFTLRPLKTQCFGLIGYLNHTSLNSIDPTKFYPIDWLSSLISTALIKLGVSVILKIFIAGILALAISGPKLDA